MCLTSKSTKFRHLQSQLHEFLIKLIMHMPYIITHVRDTYCEHGVYFGIIDEFLSWRTELFLVQLFVLLILPFYG